MRKNLLLVPLLAAACFSSKGKGGPGSPDGGPTSNHMPDGGDVNNPPPLPDAGSTSTAGGPSFLTLGTDVTSITQGQSVTFSAVVTDPDGLADIAGGVLKSQTGSVYGPFVASGTPGTYSFVLTWTALSSVEPITFATSAQRTVTADFYDAAGHEATRGVTLTLTCPGQDGKVGYADSGSCRLKCGASASAPFCDDSSAACCGSECSYLDTIEHCGSCDPCPQAPPHGSAVCEGYNHSCTYYCDGAYDLCNDACVQLHTDANCYQCGDTCMNGDTCQESDTSGGWFGCCPPQSCMGDDNNLLTCYDVGRCSYRYNSSSATYDYYMCVVDQTGQTAWEWQSGYCP